jgi:hypothetical protein
MNSVFCDQSSRNLLQFGVVRGSVGITAVPDAYAVPCYHTYPGTGTGIDHMLSIPS